MPENGSHAASEQARVRGGGGHDSRTRRVLSFGDQLDRRASPRGPTGRAVHLSGDGIDITPREYTALLDDLCQKADITQDTYLLGGLVEQFEQHWAQWLGKETAVFMPSGTLANQLALRALAGTKRRISFPR